MTLREPVSDPYYRDRAELHAPKTTEEVAKAARDLAASGFSDHTIAAILKIDTNYLRQLIGQHAA
jgi:hypothetical protein